MRDLYECENCEVSWEVYDRSIKKPTPRKRCPKCNKLCSTVIGTPFIIWKGGGWDSTKREFKRFKEKGMDKDTADNFLGQEIKFSKERMKKAGSGYTRFEPNIENQIKNGRAVRVSDKKAAKKLDTSRKITEIHYAKMGKKAGWRNE